MANRITDWGGNNWVNGDVLQSADLIDTLKQATFVSMPLGSITAWHKSFANTPTLPGQWVECNGQTLDDAESVFDGQVIPDLNGAVGTGLKGRFLRGHSESGITEASQNLSHSHTFGFVNNQVGTAGNVIDGASGGANATATTSGNGGDEARPNNYSVVWIMRVK